MTGYLLLEGGGEFGGRMAEPDRRALELAGGTDSPLAVFPTAAAPDNNHRRAGENARRWFTNLGANRVSVLPLIDRASAEDAEMAAAIESARFIYILGGFPGYLAQTLAGSRAWQAALLAHQGGAVLGGSSAGAMLLAEHLYDPYQGRLAQGLGLLAGVCILPHHSQFGKSWAALILAELPGVTLLGIDERTGLINDGPGGTWNIYGQGQVAVYRGEEIRTFRAGERLALSEPD